MKPTLSFTLITTALKVGEHVSQILTFGLSEYVSSLNIASTSFPEFPWLRMCFSINECVDTRIEKKHSDFDVIPCH